MLMVAFRHFCNVNIRYIESKIWKSQDYTLSLRHNKITLIHNITTTMKEIVSTPNAPAAVGAYSQAVKVNGMLFASGQLGLNPATGDFAGADFKSQAEQSLKNVKAIVEAAGTTMDKVVKVSVFMADMADFAALNELYSQFFTQPYPARSAVAVKTLPKGGLIEIEVIAEL